MFNKKRLTLLSSIWLLSGSWLFSTASYAWSSNKNAQPAREESTVANLAAKTTHDSNSTKIADNIAPTERVNINNVSVETLQNMKFMSKTKAQKIVKYREEHGPFKSLDELLNVKCRGIHQNWLDKVGSMFTI